MTVTTQPTRLTWWSNLGLGSVEYAGLQLRIVSRPPVLRHIPDLRDLCFDADRLAKYLQPASGPRRDMERSEIDECVAYVKRVADAAYAASAKAE